MFRGRCSPSTSILMRWNALYALFVKLKYVVTIFIFFYVSLLPVKQADGKVFSTETRESRLLKSLQRNFSRNSGQLDSRNIFFYFGNAFMGETISRDETVTARILPASYEWRSMDEREVGFRSKRTECGRNRGGEGHSWDTLENANCWIRTTTSCCVPK